MLLFFIIYIMFYLTFFLVNDLKVIFIILHYIYF